MMITNTLLRKSSLEDLFLKSGPGTSNHLPYHKALLVFYLEFKLAPVCEYLNYYYNITNNYWTIPEQIQGVGFEGILFCKKTLKFLGLSIYPWKFWTKQSFILANTVKLYYTSWKFQGKNEDLQKFNMIFSQSILEIPLLFQLTPGIYKWYFSISMKIFSLIYCMPFTFVKFTSQLFSSADASLKDEIRLLLLWEVR